MLSESKKQLTTQSIQHAVKTAIGEGKEAAISVLSGAIKLKRTPLNKTVFIRLVRITVEQRVARTKLWRS